VRQSPEKEIAAIADDSGVVLSVVDRKILAGALQGHSVSEIANRTGVHPDRVRAFLRAHNAPLLRRAFQKLLDSKGLDADRLASFAAEALGAERAAWNMAEQEFQMFPDWGSRVAVWKHLTRLHDLEPDHGKGAAPAALQVVINANLGDPTAAVRDQNHLTIEVDAKEAKNVSKRQRDLLDENAP
jgi:hypothetical protein